MKLDFGRSSRYRCELLLVDGFEPSRKAPPGIERGFGDDVARRGGAAGRPLMGFSGSKAVAQRNSEVMVRTVASFMVES